MATHFKFCFMDHWLLIPDLAPCYAWVGAAISALAALGSVIGGSIAKRKSEQSESLKSDSSVNDAVASGVSALGSIANSVYNQKMQMNNQLALMNKANEYNSHSMHRAVEDARSVGLSPLTALSGGLNAYSSATPSVPLGQMADLSSVSDLPFKIKQMSLNESSVNSQNNLNDANAQYLKSLAKGQDINNTFLGDTLALKTQLTQAEYRNAIYLQGYFASNPDLLNAVAEKQKVLNDNISSSTSVNSKQLEVFDSIIVKNASDISLNEKKIASMYISDMLNKAQIQEVTDRNLRENLSNVGYLVDRMRAVSNSNLPDDVKSSKLALLRDLYDQASGNSRMRLQYQYDKTLQDQRIAGQQESVDKYVDLQHDRLDWEKTAFTWNKVFEVVDKVGDALIPFYQQKQGQDFRREMQQNEFQHDFDMDKSRYHHDSILQQDRLSHDSNERKKDRDQRTSEFVVKRSEENDKYNNYYDETDSWYDENGTYHSVKYHSKKKK